MIKKPYEKPRVRKPAKDEIISMYGNMSEEAKQRRMDEPDPIQKKRYEKLLAKGTRRLTLSDGRKVYIRNVSQEELNIIELLKSRGINVEEPFKYEIHGDSKLAPMGFLDMGPDIRSVLDHNPDKERTVSIMTAYFNELGKMHTLGIEHKHPHLKNATYKDGRVHIIDFSLAQQKEINWKDAKSIMSAFYGDYSTILLDSYFLCTRTFGSIRVAFEKMIENYPITKETRSELLAELRSRTQKYYINRFGEEEKNDVVF